MAVYSEKIKNRRKAATELSAPFNPPSPPSPPHNPEGNAIQIEKPSTKTSSSPGVKTLSSYIDVQKSLELPQKEIEYIWRLRHASDPQSLCAVIPNSTYNRIRKIATQHPQFILPLPREGQGAEIHFLEWTFPTPTTATVLFTHFAEYRLRGEFSQPHTIVTHHMDLAEPKGLVLLQGNVVEGRGITVEDGKWLLMCLQKFYGGDTGNNVRKKLLEQFTSGDLRFEVEELLKEAEKII
ncbi:hypothetical protein MMC07_008389 [Pseudocyphellaria aurata]|nr:hypothetical protein [Pseudocyphellaria aurata]